eukprot:g11072.t1
MGGLRTRRPSTTSIVEDSVAALNMIGSWGSNLISKATSPSVSTLTSENRQIVGDTVERKNVNQTERMEANEDYNGENLFEGLQLYSENDMHTSLIRLRLNGVSVSSRIEDVISFEWWINDLENSKYFRQIEGANRYYYQPCYLDVGYQICLKCIKKGSKARDKLEKGATLWLKLNHCLQENPCIMIEANKNFEGKFCRYDVVDPVDGEKYCLEFDLRDCISLVIQLYHHASTTKVKKFVYPSDGEHFRIVYDSADAKALNLVFSNNSQANTKENFVEIDNHTQHCTVFATLCSDSITRDVIVESLLGFTKLLMPYEQPDIFVRRIDLNSSRTNASANASRDQKLDFVPTTGRNEVYIDGLTYDSEGDENTRLLYVRSLQAKLSDAVSAKQHLQMELEIAHCAFDEIKCLYSNQEESLQTLNEKLEVSHASFLIAEASKNDLELEIAQLKGQVKQYLPTDTRTHNVSTSPVTKKELSKHDTNEILNSDPACKTSKSPVNIETNNASKNLYQDERLAQLIKDANIAKEQLKSHELKEKEFDRTIKNLKKSWQEDRFQASAADSRHQRLVGELTSTQKRLLRETEVYKHQFDAMKSEYEAKGEQLKKEIIELQQTILQKDESMAKERESVYEMQKVLDCSISNENKAQVKVAKLNGINEELRWNNDKLMTERNALRRQLASLKKDLLKVAHYDVLVNEKEELILQMQLYKAQALENADNIKVFQNACRELKERSLLPSDLKFLLDFC